jgi:sugar (pentulose or hexulose) kinase
MTTLSGYIHWQLTGQKIVGVGEASGMFPVDSATGEFDSRRIVQFNRLAAEYRQSWKLGTFCRGYSRRAKMPAV